MDLGLEGKIVFITASSSGIGLSTAEAFLREGSKVIINGRRNQKLEDIGKMLQESYGERVDCFCGDMTDDRTIADLGIYIAKKYRKLDVLVANLGSGKPEYSNYLEENEWKRFYDINVFGEVKLLDRLYELLKEGRESCVTLMSSVVAKEYASAPIGYAASKSAIRILNKYISRKWVDDGIRVNCVLPGNVFFEGGRWEELLKDDEEAVLAYINDNVPMKRFGKPEEIADAIVFLSSRRASFMTGSELTVDGGQSVAI